MRQTNDGAGVIVTDVRDHPHRPKGTGADEHTTVLTAKAAADKIQSRYGTGHPILSRKWTGGKRAETMAK